MITMVEGKKEYSKIEQKVVDLFSEFGVDFNTQDTWDTPRRLVEMYKELTIGLKPMDMNLTAFENTDKFNQMIVEQDIPYQSLCSHHMIPFFGVCHIGYLPQDKYIGLSKMARVVEYFSKKPSIQERLTQEVADFLYEHVKPFGLIVVTEGRHLCMEMRGVKKPNICTKFSVIKGVIDKNEFFNILSLSKK